jgi:hypothetical protein
VPVFWPRVTIAGDQNEYAGKVPGVFQGELVKSEPVKKPGWSLITKVKVYGSIALVLWLLGFSGIAWLWRRAVNATRQVVAGAEVLKDKVQAHITEDEANEVLRTAQNKDTQALVKRIKNG